MTTVACVLRSGGIYAPEWVARLRDGVSRNLGSHRFVCFSDVDVPCERIKLLHDWPGWWAKIEVFRLHGPVLYLDLDSVITGPIGPLFRDRFTMVRDFYRPTVRNSSVMAWPGSMTGVYEAFAAKPSRIMAEYERTHDNRIGDQAFIEDYAEADTFEPGLVASYKADIRKGNGKGASVVQFHGKPKPNEVPGWW